MNKDEFNSSFNCYTIESEKQTNGVWGIPVFCRKIDKLLPLSNKNYLKQSAFLISIAEIHKQNFDVCLSNKNGFSIYLYKDKKHICFNYDNYEIEGNKIIYKNP
jgi:hypothetical protein